MESNYSMPSGKIFESRAAFLLLCFSLPLLFMPKINFFQFEGQTAGVRIDDFLLFIFALFFYWGYFSCRRRLLKIEMAVLSIVSLSFFSYGMNKLNVASGYLHVNASIFYCIRLFEYFLFFYIGIMASRFIPLGILIRTLIGWNLLLMLLQYFEIIGVFTLEGYQAVAEDHRFLGIASFGAEMGLLLNLFFCFLIYEKTSKKSTIEIFPKPVMRFIKTNKAFFLLILFITLVILTGARIAIAAILFSFLIRLKDLVRWRSPGTFLMPLITLGVAAGLMAVLLLNASGIVTRSQGLLSFSNLELIPVVWDNIVLDYDPIGRETVSYDGYDASWWMRIHKWCYALKIYWSHPLAWLTGVGPGFAMAALDGGIIRILTELGIIGIALYGWLFYLIGSISKPLKWMVAALVINMLFFDVYLAYKPMSLLFLMAGYAFSDRQKIYENLAQS